MIAMKAVGSGEREISALVGGNQVCPASGPHRFNAATAYDLSREQARTVSESAAWATFSPCYEPRSLFSSYRAVTT